MNKLIIQSVSGATYPLEVYVADAYGNNQTHLGTVASGPIPPGSAEFTNIPMLLQTAPQVMVTLVDSNGCGKFGLFNCSGLELKIIVQEGPYFILQTGGFIIAQQYSKAYNVCVGMVSPDCAEDERSELTIYSPSVLWSNANRFFTGQDMSIPFSGGSKWYANDYDVIKQYQINNDGYIISAVTCS